MKILFLTNNPAVAFPLFSWLQQAEGSDNVTLCSEKISVNQFLTGNPFSDIEFIISYNYIHIIKQDVISLFPHKVINLHISMLPWNRGMHPNIWSFLEGTPPGVTIHEIDGGLDTGDVLLQQGIIFDYTKETLKSSYEKSHILITKLFCDNWDKIKNGIITPKSQQGTKHYKKDIDALEHIIDYDDTIETFIHKYNQL